MGLQYLNGDVLAWGQAKHNTLVDESVKVQSEVLAWLGVVLGLIIVEHCLGVKLDFALESRHDQQRTDWRCRHFFRNVELLVQ